MLLAAGCAGTPMSTGGTSGLPGRLGVVATVHPLATRAGVDAMRRGGNAVDAAVAAALVLGIVDGHNSGIGGGCFMIVRCADGRLLAIDGREMVPAAAYRDMYLRNGEAVPELSRIGALAVGVPGSLAAYEYVLRQAGRRSLNEPLRSAADLADRGFPIDANYAKRLADTVTELARHKASAVVFLDPAGRPWPHGHHLQQPDLARTYRAIAAYGIGWFYGGPFAELVDTWMREHGGLVRASDFAGYELRHRRPVVSTYRGYTIVGFPPPSSGGTHVAQILNILEYFDLRRLEAQDPALRRHVMAQAMKLAFADRAHWLGDPDFAAVPRGLIDRDYARSLADRIQLHRNIKVDGHATPPRATDDVFSKHTTHIAAADSDGNWVAITTTLNTAFGSTVTVPGTGVLLNNQMDDFSAQPGVPNVFGLIGAEANSVQPRKRPLSSMSPTVVLKDDRPILTLGAAGGPTIISQVVQAIVNIVDLEMNLSDAVAAPRIHHQWRPNTLYAESGLDPPIVERLGALGHAIKQRDLGLTQAIVRGEDGALIGVHDPRIEGMAMGIAE